MRPFHYYLISTGMGIAIGSTASWQKFSSESILRANSIQPSFPSRTTNLQKWAAPGANTLGSVVKLTNAKGKLSHPKRSELVGDVVSLNLVENLPSNNSVRTHLHTTSKQKIELPRGIASPLTLAESEGYIQNLQRSISESILPPNSIQAGFPVPPTNPQERKAHESEFLGNTQQSQKSSNNTIFVEVKGREENASPSAQLDQSSPENLPQQTPGDITELEPKPNPLLRPSLPEEVQINKTVPITLQQALQLARRNNQQLQVAELELQRSRLAVQEIQSALYPTVGIEAGLSRDSSAQGQLSVESQQREIEGQNRQNQQQISQLQADLDALRNSPVPAPTTDPAAFVQRELAISQLQSQVIQAQESLVQTQSSRLRLENFATTTLSSSVTLNYDLFTSGRRSANIRAVEEQVRFDELELERVAEQLRLDITDAYYNLQDADQQVRI